MLRIGPFESDPAAVFPAKDVTRKIPGRDKLSFGKTTQGYSEKVIKRQRLRPVVPAQAGTSVHNVLGSCFRRNDG